MVEETRISVERYCPGCEAKFARDSNLISCPDDGAELLPVTTDKLVGKVIAGKFELLKVIGVGGGSTVYLAKHISLDRLVAFKILRSDMISTVDRIKRFEHEARLASSLNHPNICTIYDCGLLDTGQPYLVLEYVEGRSLVEILEQGRIIPEFRALRIIKQIASGLKSAHESGILHRDLKPGNIMIIDAGQVDLVKIIDFGLAKALGTENAAELTETGHTIGTPAYMSPEQVRGKALDERSDIYSFGCVIFEILTGTRAISGRTTFETMQNHLNSDPQPLISGDYVVPFSLRELTLKCLHKDPKQRFQNMNEMIAAIEQLENNKTFSREHPVLSAHGKRPSWLVAAAILAIVTLGIAAYFMSSARRDAPSSSQSVDKPAAAKIDPRIDKLIKEAQKLEKTNQNLAERVYLRTFSTLRDEGKDYSPEMVALSKEMQAFYYRIVRRSAMEPYVQSAFEAQKRLATPGSEELLQAYKDAGEAYEKAGDLAKALPYYQNAATLTRQRYGDKSRAYFDALYQQAAAEWRQGEIDKAEADFTYLVEANDAKQVQTEQFRLQVLLDLCTFYTAQRKLDEAQKIADEAVAAMSTKTPHDLQVKVFKAAAQVAERRHDHEQAIALIERALGQSALMANGKQPFYLTDELLTEKGSCLRKAKRYKEAEAVLNIAVRQMGQSHFLETNEYRWSLNEYIKLLRETGRAAEADALAKSGRLK